MASTATTVEERDVLLSRWEGGGEGRREGGRERKKEGEWEKRDTHGEGERHV